MEKTFRYMIRNKKNNNGNIHTRHPAVHNMTSQISPSAVYRKFTSIQSRGDNTGNAMAEKQRKLGSCILPLARVKTIMKSSPDVCNISQEALFLITKSTVAAR